MKLKKTFLLFMLSFILCGIFTPVQASENIKIRVNNEFVYSDVAPFIQNGRTMVPIRVISEKFGYIVNWDDQSKSALIFNPEEGTGLCKGAIAIQAGEYRVLVLNPENVNASYLLYSTGKLTADQAIPGIFENSSIKEIDSPPVIVNGRTFVPLRAIAELFGFNVSWNDANRIVDIK